VPAATQRKAADPGYMGWRVDPLNRRQGCRLSRYQLQVAAELGADNCHPFHNGINASRTLRMTTAIMGISA
jgi:hypothetical protein